MADKLFGYTSWNIGQKRHIARRYRRMYSRYHLLIATDSREAETLMGVLSPRRSFGRSLSGIIDNIAMRETKAL
jgi:hypothetical protein